METREPENYPDARRKDVPLILTRVGIQQAVLNVVTAFQRDADQGAAFTELVADAGDRVPRILPLRGLGQLFGGQRLP
jgi:hypothetical protein